MSLEDGNMSILQLCRCFSSVKGTKKKCLTQTKSQHMNYSTHFILTVLRLTMIHILRQCPLNTYQLTT